MKRASNDRCDGNSSGLHPREADTIADPNFVLFAVGMLQEKSNVKPTQISQSDMPPMNTIDECRLLEFPRVQDPRGALTFIENCRQIPFDIKRVYYLYDVPGGATRAGHSHKALQQVLIAMSGSFDVHVDDGISKKTYSLNRSYIGLYIPTMVWREVDNFSSGSVCVSLASELYEESDYYRAYEDFLTSRGLK